MERPLVALLTSPIAESRAASRGFTSVSQLLTAFSNHQIQLRDPTSPQPTQTTVSLDFRDLRKEGHLLSLSVLPHVLHESLASSSSLDVGVQRFLSCVQRWAEPVEQETLRHFIACVFIVSPHDENPMSELSKLVQTQHTMQHSSMERGVTPAFCASPRWMTPNTMKHYILLCDTTADDPNLSEQVFTQMCSFYGPDSCDMIKLGNSMEETEQEDLWAEEEQYELLLQRGLERARRHAAMKAAEAESAQTASQTVSTISPSYVLNSIPTTTTSHQASAKATRRLSATDREAVRIVIEKFATKNLTAHVEKLMRTLTEQTAARRGIIGRSLTSGVKKWLQSSQTPANQPQANISYSIESNEMQLRRLADLAFLFGLYAFAQQQYRTVKKDFENNEAYLYQATALEMCALTTYLGHVQLRQFPIHYLENAFVYLIQYGGRYTSIVRCAVNICRILLELEMPREAASLLTKLTNVPENDLCVAIVQSEAARCFSIAKRQRKASFYSVLAANRFFKADINHLAIACYRSCTAMYIDRQWGGIERQLYASLCNDASDATSAIDLSDDVQKESLRTFIIIAQRALQSNDSRKLGFTLPCPQIEGDITVIYGEAPSSETARFYTTADWENLERAAFHAVAGPTTPFRLPSLVASSSTNNRRQRAVPVGERYRVLCPLHNPLSIPLSLTNLRLRIAHAATLDGSAPTGSTIHCLAIERLNIEPNSTILVELSAIPQANCKEFAVDGIEVQIESDDSQGQQKMSIQGVIPVRVRGQRLNNTPKEIKQMAYAKDERLSCTVVPSKWPLLDVKVFRPAPIKVFCDQAIKLIVDVENTGSEEVTSLACAIDSINTATVAVMEGENRVPCPETVSANSQAISTFKYSSPIGIRGKIRMLFDMKAPEVECENYSMPVMLAYRGAENSFSLYSLNLKNCLSADVLARIELQRIRMTSPNKKGLKLSSNQQIVLESGQSYAVCLSAGSNLPNEPIQFVPSIDCPKWMENEARRQNEANLFAVLWKANIINADGQNMCLVGETIIRDPKANSIPEDALSMSEKGLDDSTQENIPANMPLQINCSRLPPVYHSFKAKRICEVPFSFVISNKDELNRDANVVVRFVPKVREQVNSLAQLAPDNRQQYMVDRSQLSAQIKAGASEKFNFVVKVWQPSVYELGGSQFIMEAQLGEEKFTQKVNPLFDLSDMASQTQGIQQLLQAEKRAADKINEARKRKLQRMKQAKQEAQSEVEKFKLVSRGFFLKIIFTFFLKTKFRKYQLI
ncbi:hypothetical protein WR25_21053 [Diploscapter pachys]|uniref:TPPC8 first Ig-like domain-containing protein n=1 Tax=Diploscapter pachys TaxID=2018661 RepID=A0A2A2KS03_9BILA|nr:hypothetical protein WR25_21053 [Diploscapter pachys]